jgi:hypothetical protein
MTCAWYSTALGSSYFETAQGRLPDRAQREATSIFSLNLRGQAGGGRRHLGGPADWPVHGQKHPQNRQFWGDRGGGRGGGDRRQAASDLLKAPREATGGFQTPNLANGAGQLLK